MMEKGKRNSNLDAMRVLACMAVVGLHTISNKRSAVEMCFYLVCGFAVPVFFMASGYTLLSRERVGYGYVARKAGQLLGLAVGWHVLFWLLELTADVVRGNFSLRWVAALPGEFFDSFSTGAGFRTSGICGRRRSYTPACRCSSACARGCGICSWPCSAWAAR